MRGKIGSVNFLKKLTGGAFERIHTIVEGFTSAFNEIENRSLGIFPLM
jgi:hypothetical protein